jgi:hypothetical protein
VHANCQLGASVTKILKNNGNAYPNMKSRN